MKYPSDRAPFSISYFNSLLSKNLNRFYDAIEVILEPDVAATLEYIAGPELFDRLEEILKEFYINFEGTGPNRAGRLLNELRELRGKR
jgi:hypothetical protein